MDRDTDLFVQAFWVKCREVIRPEIDRSDRRLKSAGHDANVSTQEYSAGRRRAAGQRTRPDAHRPSQAARPAGAASLSSSTATSPSATSRSSAAGGRRIATSWRPSDEPRSRREIADWLAGGAQPSSPDPSTRKSHARRHRRPVPPLRQGLQQGRCRGDRRLRNRRFRMAPERRRRAGRPGAQGQGRPARATSATRARPIARRASRRPASIAPATNCSAPSASPASTMPASRSTATASTSTR